MILMTNVNYDILWLMLTNVMVQFNYTQVLELGMNQLKAQDIEIQDKIRLA